MVLTVSMLERKIFSVRETFNYKFTFEHSGLARASMKEQLAAWQTSLKFHGYDTGRPKSWLEAFNQLKELIIASPKKKKVIFIDEMPWMDTPKSGFISALEFFWNGWASARKDITLIVCGSATSWIINKTIRFQEDTKSTKSIHQILISANGVKRNAYSDIVPKNYRR